MSFLDFRGRYFFEQKAELVCPISEISENKQQKISVIKFVGNNFYSEKYLSSIIQSQSIKFYNILVYITTSFSTFAFNEIK